MIRRMTKKRIRTFRQALRRAQDLVNRYVPKGRSLAAELIAERRGEAKRDVTWPRKILENER